MLQECDMIDVKKCDLCMLYKITYFVKDLRAVTRIKPVALSLKIMQYYVVTL